MIYSVNNTGEFGIIKDQMPHELPPNAWTDGENVRFVDGYAQKADGYSQVFGTPGNAAYSLMPVAKISNYNWLQMGTQKVYAFDGSNHVNITRQTTGVDVNYTGTVNDIWTGCVLGNVPIINNGVDTPQQWLPSTSATKLVNLTNWPAATSCLALRNYKQFLVALNVTKASVQFPQMVKWSHPADPGTVPVTWDPTDATRDAGEYTLSETGDFVVDSTPLRDSNIIYKEASTWAMQFVGGVDIFRFTKLFGTFGALGRNCAVEFLTGKHLVLTQGDVVVHDGQSAESVLNKKQRKWLNDNINQNALTQCFVVNYSLMEEVWICICTGANTLANLALVWNWRSGAVGWRDLPNVSFIAPGLVNATITADTWSTVPGTWDSDPLAWGTKLYNSAAPNLLMSSPLLPKLYKVDTDANFDGVAPTVLLERTGFSVPFAQSLLPDFTSMKFMRAIWPRITGTIGTTMQVQVGTQMEIGGAVSWKPAQNYVIGTTKKINVTASGRLFGIRFLSTASLQWKLHGYEVDIDGVSNF